MQLRLLRQSFSVSLGILALSLVVSDLSGDEVSSGNSQPASKTTKSWKPLVGKWKPIEFGGEGEVVIDDKQIRLGMGSPLTGVRWTGKVPRENYELTLEARRTEGLDFFCGLTFPVGKDHVSFILGGWGGGVVGISSIDGYDASENDTTMYQQFKMNQWYKVRVQLTPSAIKCWIDDLIAVDQEREGRTFDIRFEMDESTPLGIASFQCKSELRNLRIRELTPEEIKGEIKAEIQQAKAEQGESSDGAGKGP